MGHNNGKIIEMREGEHVVPFQAAQNGIGA